MPRKQLIRTKYYPYHVCTRSNNKEWFRIPLDQVWQFCLESLVHSLSRCPVKIHALILMQNHYHLLLTTPNADIDTFMYFFNKALADRLRVQSKRINRVFGGPYNWCLVDHQNYLYNVVRYIFQNPVRAGICKKVQEYPYSTLIEKNLPIKIDDLLEVQISNPEMLKWLNQLPPASENEVIKKGLRRKSFAPAKDPNTGKTFKLTGT